MFECKECDLIFKEPAVQKDIYDVENDFENVIHTETFVCPRCGGYFVELIKCDGCHNYFEEDELMDTESFINGGIGYVCRQCLEDNDIVI